MMTLISDHSDKTPFTIGTVIPVWSGYHLARSYLSFVSSNVMRYIGTIYNNKICRVLEVSMILRARRIKTALTSIIFKIISLTIFVEVIVVCPLLVSLATPPTPLGLDNMQNPLNQKVPSPWTVGLK